ncbi:MAG TPA: cytochrome P450 [Steroidobacteraceae bacterium]|nr:cytochrome P450 [Steroidobacteraceae bacterium]
MNIPDSIAAVVVDPKCHGNGKIHEAFKWLRDNQPIGYAVPQNTDPFWIVTRQADIKAIAKQNDLFHSGDRNITIIDREEERRYREMTAGRPSMIRTIVQMDPPDHAKYRNVAAAFFKPANLLPLESQIRAIARQSVDVLAQMGGRCDFAKDIAFLYPLRVIMSVIGIPMSDEKLILRLAQEYFGVNDADAARNAQDNRGIAAADMTASIVKDFNDYFDALLADRRKRPRNDMASVVANALIDGAPIPQLEARSYCLVAATAGHDTTSASSAGGIWALCENPRELAKVQANPGLVPGVMEESIRWTSPSKITMRAAVRDTEIVGTRFRQGDWVGLAWASGNRDDRVIDDPFSFRVDRATAPHLAFGWGPHGCLGQHLARIELRILFEELFARLRTLELDGKPEGLPSLQVSGPKSVPIRYTLK